MKHLTRLSWNSNRWNVPSGRENKCKGTGDVQLYECIYGFGWEEWLFHFIEHTDGYCYGFLECFNKPHRKHTIINELHLYTRKCKGSCEKNAKSETLYVGKIEQLEVLGQEHKSIANTIVLNNETMMKESLKRAGVENYQTIFSDMKLNNNIFNVRFKKASLTLSNAVDQEITLPHPFYKFMLYDITDKGDFLKTLNQKLK